MPTTDAVPARRQAPSSFKPRRVAWRRALRTRVSVALLALSVLAGGVAATAEPVAAASKSGVLKKGSRGAAVKELQRALGIEADGVYGPATRRAVRRFQRAKGLTVDGIAGPATLAALGIARGSKASREERLLDAIAQCESGGDPTAVSRNGRYRGKYQFSRATWRALGGKGDPAKAPEAEQDRRAAALLAAEGTKPWPHCGRRARSGG